MELPHLGRNCAFLICNRLDYLPVKCDGCSEWFCSDHFAYAHHDCPAPNLKDFKVPACPLCGVPVPGRLGVHPDAAVAEHIDNQCQSDPAKEKRKVFTNRCSYKGCKTKEMMPIVCNDCDLNFCLKHRHGADHACTLEAKRRNATVRYYWPRWSRWFSIGNSQGAGLENNYYYKFKVIGAIIVILYVILYVILMCMSKRPTAKRHIYDDYDDDMDN